MTTTIAKLNDNRSMIELWDDHVIYISTDSDDNSGDDLDHPNALDLDMVHIQSPEAEKGEFTMDGPLTISFCCLGEKQRDALASKNDFLDDEVVTMALNHVCNLFPGLQRQVQVLPALWVANWMQKCSTSIDTADKKTLKFPKSIPLLSDWRQRQIIAYPIHSPNHWTLAMLVNLTWSDTEEEHQKMTWTGFHFDSYPCNNNAIAMARTIGQHLTGTRHRKNLSFKDIMVPGQANQSNDCALWPAHYLKVFLQDIDFFISYCNMETDSSPRNSEKKMKIWEADLGPHLRKSALKLFDFYRDGWFAAKENLKSTNTKT